MDYDFNRLLADAARELAQEPSVVTTLEHLVQLCTDEVPGCDHACISVAEAGEIRTLAATDEALASLDRLQATLGEGPCLDTLQSPEAVVSNDLGHDQRWPSWSPRVVEEAGLRSLMSFCVFSSGESAGALILYSRKDDGFDHEDLLEAQVLAAQAAVALATTLKERQLHQALQTRTVIGQATGILIERFGLAPDGAFAVMRRVSQNHNIKLHVLAEHLVETGILLDPNGADGAPRPVDRVGRVDDGGSVDGHPVDGVRRRSAPTEDSTRG
jgi:GAF domain-containing protein